MEIPRDRAEGRVGEWMQTSLGGQFFPADPRPVDIRMSDIANGLALDCRYGGQGRVDRYYSVAEHSVHIARAARRLEWPHRAVFAALLHDAAEAYLNDVVRAVKAAFGPAYKDVEDNVQNAILERYGLIQTASAWRYEIKKLDARIVPLEKAAIMRHHRSWAHDMVEPLSATKIWCLPPAEAKLVFVSEYWQICDDLGIEREEIEP